VSQPDVVPISFHCSFFLGIGIGIDIDINFRRGDYPVVDVLGLLDSDRNPDPEIDPEPDPDTEIEPGQKADRFFQYIPKAISGKYTA
jgi:hypothetical protein